MTNFEEQFPSTHGLLDIHTFSTCECAVHQHARSIMLFSCLDKQLVKEAIERCKTSAVREGDLMHGYDVISQDAANRLLKEMGL